MADLLTDRVVAQPVAVQRPSEASGEIEATVVERPYREPLSVALRDAWRYRHVAVGLAAQVVTLKTPRSILGVWWVPINLIFSSVAIAFIFGTILSVPSASGVPYFIFATVGGMSWWVLNRGTLFSMRSFHRFRHYVSTLSFPLILVPFAGVAQLAVEIGFITVFLAGCFIVFWGIDGQLYLNLSPELLLAPISLLWLVLFAASIGLITGPVYWRARDVRQLFRLALPFWMYVTPIVYPLSSLTGAVKIAATLNPASAPVELFKAGLIGTELPPAYGVASGVGVTVSVLALGLWFTNRFSANFLAFGADADENPDDDVA